MIDFPYTGAMVREFRKQVKVSQKALAAKTQVADPCGIGISDNILSKIENGKRHLTPKYFKLLVATDVFTHLQVTRLRDQAIADLILREFGSIPLYLRYRCSLTDADN